MRTPVSSFVLCKRCFCGGRQTLEGQRETRVPCSCPQVDDFPLQAVAVRYNRTQMEKSCSDEKSFVADRGIFPLWCPLFCGAELWTFFFVFLLASVV